MKTNKKVNTVSIDSEFKPGNFGMIVDAKSFGIIIDGIYSNTIEAIIREYSCNAIDSHKQAGHMKKFDMHLPTYTQPVFYIRDYGVGLDEDDIVNVFTVAFKSTKENSNLTTGQLGIGAMCAFAYNTKSFTVTSWKNGIKYVYNCFINEEGCPSYIKLDQSNSDEPNGVLVEITCSKNDCNEFKNAAQNILQYCDIIPNIVSGNASIAGYRLSVNKPIYETDKYLIYRKSSDRCRVLMGNVLYKIPDVSSIKNKFSNLDFFNDNIILIAEIGDIDFATSREFIKLTPKTIDFLLNSFKKIKSDLRNNILEIVNKEKNPWAKLQALHSSSLYYNQHLRPLFNGNDNFINNISIGENLTLIQYANSIINAIYKYSQDASVAKVFKPYGTMRGYKQYGVTKIDSNYLLNNNIKLIRNDKSGCISAIGRFTKTNNLTCLIFDNSINIAEIFMVPEDEIILASSLPKPPRIAYNRATREKSSEISKWTLSASVLRSWITINDEFDANKTYYYVERNYNNYIDHNGKEARPYTLQAISNAAKVINIDSIYGVKSKYIQKLGKNWVNIFDHMRSIFTTQEFDKEHVEFIISDALHDIVHGISANYRNELSFIKDNKDLIKNNDIIEWSIVMNDYSKSIISDKEDLYNVFQLITGKEINALQISANSRYKEVNKNIKIIKNYPLFTAALYYNSRPYNDPIHKDIILGTIKGE